MQVFLSLHPSQSGVWPLKKNSVPILASRVPIRVIVVSAPIILSPIFIFY
jgi:hypothetical protein